ncbi:hypothetical protein J2Y73_005124 [Peribacillus frigoritolerans]|uniref:restriction endonuclease n=1 Tax=Peribacillus frigoritolerans TaxID=450367 RepID=UPI0020A09E9F|nr:restriction endonuclease [Peribacillus frigoritolerans]MCP1495093.1 hypothetical protein [Peribacillus frigoritolerans]
MLDVFTEEIEVHIKQGMANLYWFLADLKKAWLRAGVDPLVCNELFSKKNVEKKSLTKRELMDELYETTRSFPYNKRLEISRNFVRFLIEHENFVPQKPNHKIDVAERSALRLKDIYYKQKEKRDKESFKPKTFTKSTQVKENIGFIQETFIKVRNLAPQQRGYAFEKMFPQLMAASNISVYNSFKIEGEQIDGAIKFDSHYYLVELKWTEKKISQAEIASLYMKVEGKFEGRGIMISMNGYSQEVIKSLPKGKGLKIILLDGIHLSNVIFGNYSFPELLEYAIEEAVLKGNIFCDASKVLK